MKDEDFGKARGQILHIPNVLGAVVLTTNVPGVAGELKLSSDAIAAIFLGKITKWNEPAFALPIASSYAPISGRISHKTQ